ncbi:MAG TPA: hypothetical protein VFV08_01190 [Puia sp.]|nr:hypothetical protein [Puia sp.]
MGLSLLAKGQINSSIVIDIHFNERSKLLSQQMLSVFKIIPMAILIFGNQHLPSCVPSNKLDTIMFFLDLPLDKKFAAIEF